MDTAWQELATRLAAANGGEWKWEHTGGGCYALVCRIGDTFTVATWADDTFTNGCTPSDVDVHGGFMIGRYEVDEEGYWSGEPYDYETVPDLEGLTCALRADAR